MEKNKMKKTVWGASVALVLTTGAALGVSAYQSGIDFHPSEEKNTFRPDNEATESLVCLRFAAQIALALHQ